MKQMTRCWSAFLVMFLFASAANAQQPLAGTAWQGTVTAPTPVEVVFQFKQDTLFMIERGSKEVMETMLYTQNGQQWTWKKVSGGSPCDDQTPGTYAYQISGDQMTIKVVKDACQGRALAISDKPFKKIAWPASQTAKKK